MAKAKETEEGVVEAPVTEVDLDADYVEVGYTQNGANTVPGGAYLVNGELVNANGEPIEKK